MTVEAKGTCTTQYIHEFYLLLYIMYFGFMSNIESLNNVLDIPILISKSFNNINYCNFMAMQLINFSILYVQIHKVFE